MFDPRQENAKKMARRRFEAREVLDREKARNPCKDCGRTYQPCQMDILPRDGRRKVPMARILHLSIERMMEEIRRSDIVCASCSRLRAHKRDRLRRSGKT